MVRVVGLEIEADGCPSRIRRHYKTTGFAPKVPYFVSLPLHPQLSPPIALASHAKTVAAIRFASMFTATVELASAPPPSLSLHPSSL